MNKPLLIQTVKVRNLQKEYFSLAAIAARTKTPANFDAKKRVLSSCREEEALLDVMLQDELIKKNLLKVATKN